MKSYAFLIFSLAIILTSCNIPSARMAPTATPLPTPTSPPPPTLTPTPKQPTPTPDPCSGAIAPGAREKFTFQKILPCLNDPVLVNAFVRNNMTYQTEAQNEYIPASTIYERGYDDCDGLAILQCYLLEKNGWDAYMIGLSIDTATGHNVCAIYLPDGILILDNMKDLQLFSSFTEIAQFYIDEGNMKPGGKIRTIRASAIETPVYNDSKPNVLELPWALHDY
jgi:predicted transglutaminase-like cysteine proteinase